MILARSRVCPFGSGRITDSLFHILDRPALAPLPAEHFDLSQ
jgi:hypothetical protein